MSLGCRRRARRPHRAGRRRGSARRGRRPRRAAGRGSASRGVLGAVGHPERQVVQRPGGLQVVRALPAQDEVAVHGVILSARVGARERVQRVAEDAALPLTSTTSSLTSSPSRATSRRAARRAGATCEDHTTSTPPGPVPSAPPRAPAGVQRCVGGVHEEVGAVVDVEEHDVPRPAWPAAPVSTSSDVGDVQGAPLALESRELGTRPARAHRTSGSASSTTSACRTRGPRAPRAWSSPGPGPPTSTRWGAGWRRRARSARATSVCVDGVHRERAVDDELEHVPAPAQRRPRRAASAPRGHGRSVVSAGLDCRSRVTVRTPNGRVARWDPPATRPFVRQ